VAVASDLAFANSVLLAATPTVLAAQLSWVKVGLAVIKDLTADFWADVKVFDEAVNPAMFLVFVIFRTGFVV
jgi:hypothetical protein